MMNLKKKYYNLEKARMVMKRKKRISRSESKSSAKYYNWYKEFLVNSNIIIMKLNDMKADKRISYLKKKIIEENKLIEEKKFKRCEDCDIIVMDTRKFITKCIKCFKIHKGFTSFTKYNFVEEV